MIRRHVRYLLGMLLVVLAVSTLRAQPEEIVLSNPEAYERKQRPPVMFPHEIHMAGDMSCTDCHHQYADGENILDESELEEGNLGILCTACHDQESQITLRQAFHRQCAGCHTRLDKEGKASGPRLCGECHRRS